MKKYLAIFLGAVFVLGFAASAFAIHAEIPSETQAVIAKGATQITLGGELRFRGELRRNTADFDSDSKDSLTSGRTHEGCFYDGRVRLSIDAMVTPNTQGFVQVEAGTGDTGDSWTWGPSTTGSKGFYNAGNVKQGSFNLLEAWILHKGAGLGIPAGFKVGHMPLALGNKLFFDHTKFGDDAIVFFADPTKELHLGVLTIKFREGNIVLDDDANAYVGLFAYNTKEFGISGDVVYVDDQRSFGTAGGAVAPSPTHFWNFGLRGNANVAGLGLKGDVEIQTGNIELPGGDLKFRGWAAMAGLSYKMAPITLTLDGAWGSGDDGEDSGKFKSFVTALGVDQHFTYVYEYSTVNACGLASGGLCNTIYIKGGIAGDMTKQLSGLLNVYWLRAHEDVSLRGAAPSDELGWEVDAKLSYKIDRNLSYYVEGGILFAGEAFDSATKEADNAFAIRNGLILSF